MDSFFTHYSEVVDDLINLVFDYCCIPHNQAGTQHPYPETRPEDMVSVLAALTGEAIQYRMGLFDGKTYKGEPNGVVSDSAFEKRLFGEAFRLEHVPPEDCALGLFRQLLEEQNYPVDQGCDLVDFSRTCDFIPPTSSGYFPVTTGPEHYPDLPPLQANYDLRETVSVLTERCSPPEDPDEARYLLCMGALAKVVVNAMNDLPPTPALTLACETMIAAAKTTPYLPGQRPRQLQVMKVLAFFVPKYWLN